MKKDPGCASTEPLRVLLADDNPDILSSLTMVLELEGHVVRSVGDGGAVLPAVREFKPDACILDIGMPVQTGYSVARELRTLYGSRRLLLIAISGQWVRPSEKLMATSVGFDHFLSKPADPDEVCSLLREVQTTGPEA